jgi:hypothetical protein
MAINYTGVTLNPADFAARRLAGQQKYPTAFTARDEGITPEQNAANVQKILASAEAMRRPPEPNYDSIPVITITPTQSYAGTIPPTSPPPTKPVGAPRPVQHRGQKGLAANSYEAQGVRALQEGLNNYFGGNALKVDGIMGPKTQAMLKGYDEDFANKAAGLAAQQAQAPVAQQAPVQQPSFLGMKLDQQATEAAWDKWRSNDAPEGYIPTAVYR